MIIIFVDCFLQALFGEQAGACHCLNKPISGIILADISRARSAQHGALPCYNSDSLTAVASRLLVVTAKEVDDATEEMGWRQVHRRWREGADTAGAGTDAAGAG